MACVARSGDNLQESALSFHPVSLRTQTQVIRLAGSLVLTEF